MFISTWFQLDMKLGTYIVLEKAWEGGLSALGVSQMTASLDCPSSQPLTRSLNSGYQKLLGPVEPYLLELSASHCPALFPLSHLADRGQYLESKLWV